MFLLHCIKQLYPIWDYFCSSKVRVVRPTFHCTVEPHYNEVLGTIKITLLYQVSHYIRVKKHRNIKSWDQQIYLVIRGFCYIRPLYNEVPLYIVFANPMMAMGEFFFLEGPLRSLLYMYNKSPLPQFWFTSTFIIRFLKAPKIHDYGWTKHFPPYYLRLLLVIPKVRILSRFVNPKMKCTFIRNWNKVCYSENHISFTD